MFSFNTVFVGKGESCKIDEREGERERERERERENEEKLRTKIVTS